MKNLSKTYYKDYFKDVGFAAFPDKKGNGLEIKNSNSIIDMNIKFMESANEEYIDEANPLFSKINRFAGQSFNLIVAYPGLITGSGIDHEAKVKGEFKLGMHFDYTSGLPIIYGSSVKGVLRNAFEIDNLFEVLDEILPDYKTQIDELKHKFSIKSLKEWRDIIFGIDSDKDKDLRSVYERDIFFDAILEKTNNDKHIFSKDAITPHKQDPMKDPIPITFIRIASGCTIRFRFKLMPTEEVSANDKMEIFKLILIAFGIGAKTNVGYGRLKEEL